MQYLNARPLIGGWSGPVELDHPASLCRQLAGGQLDVALVSSFEFLRNPIYQIVDDVAIASNGPVYSVFVAHPHGIRPPKTELDPASATAVAMLRYLMAERGQELLAADVPADILCPLAVNRARLLIGDQAILFRQNFGARYDYWDLGEEWRDVAKLPFVYALWLIRPEVSDAKTIADRLRSVRDENLANLDALIAAERQFDRDFCRRYYRDHLRFNFGQKEKQGLRLFQELCVEHSLLPKHDLVFALV